MIRAQMLLIIASVLLLIALLALRELWQIFSAHPPQTPEIIRVIGDAASGQPIPKIIWTYWHAAPEPELVQRCLANWRRFNPDHELRLVHAANAQDWLTPAQNFSARAHLPAYRQADWLRLQLLAQHGGIWMDASTLLTDSLAWVHELQTAHQASFVGFFIDRYTQVPERPMVENWFLAAPPGSRFIVDLAAEFEHALALGETGYLAELRSSGELEAVAQGLPESMQDYLIMHMAASRLLTRGTQVYQLALRRAEDSAFAYLAALRWRKRHLLARLAFTPCPARVPNLIKLRGGDRQVIERNLHRVWRSSLLARYLP